MPIKSLNAELKHPQFFLMKLRLWVYNLQYNYQDKFYITNINNKCNIICKGLSIQRLDA